MCFAGASVSIVFVLSCPFLAPAIVRATMAAKQTTIDTISRGSKDSWNTSQARMLVQKLPV